MQEIAVDIPLNWLVLNAVFPLLQGVFLYLYTGFLFQKIQLKASLGFHFLPFFFFSVMIIRFGEDIINGPLVVSLILSGIIYIYLSIRIIGGFGSFFQQNNHWLKILITGLGLVWLTFIVVGMINHVFDFAPIRHEAIFLSVNLFVFAIGYFGLKEGHILQEPRIIGKYNSSPLNVDDFDQIKNRLDLLMEEKQIFLNPGFKIGDLARELSVPTHHLSQYFSAALNTNYYDYINSLRVGKLKSQIADGKLETLSLLGLAFDCGFNSKATLNRVFKKHTGQTPSEYITSQK